MDANHVKLRKIATSSRKTLNAFAMTPSKHTLSILAAGLILFSSCSSSRKAAQTPDDVYYSPGSSRAVAAADDEDGGYYSPRSGNRGDYYSTAPSDNYVRLKAQDQSRWSYFDDYNAYDSYYYPSAAISPYYGMGFGYGYPMYGYGLSYGLGLGFGNPYLGWNSYFLWNTCYNPYFYNPYYGGGAIIVKGNGSYANNMYTHLRAFDGTSYRNSLAARVTNSNNRSYRPASNVYTRDVQNGTSNRLNSTNQSSNRNSYYRPVSPNSSMNNNGSYSRPSSGGFGGGSQPVRSYSPPPSSGGGGGGGARPSRH
jgi:hypothetical protein